MNEILKISKKIDQKLGRILKILEGQNSPWLSSKEAAAYLRCSLSKVEDLTTSGLLPYRRLDPRSSRSLRLYHRRDLAAYLVAGRNPHSTPLSASERKQVKELA